jgi:DNA-binding NtrC family response regulator
MDTDLPPPALEVDTLPEEELSPATRAAYKAASRVAPSRMSVLILGQTGSGKDVLARYIHGRSPRAGAPFVAVNCAAITSTLVESELFGHERGAFSGAVSSKPGLLEAASGGTVFLDEIGDMPPVTQAKLLRALEAGEVTRVGAVRPRPVDVRFIAATNRSIGAPGASDFRSDLLYRLNGFVIELPSLAERRAEIGPLARLLLARFRRRETTRAERISEAALRRLEAHAWPGNIRELRNVIERAAVLCLGEEIGPEDLLLGPGGAAAAGRAGRPSGLRLGESVGGGGAAPAGRLGAGDELAPAVAFDDPRDERARYLWALAQCAGNQTRAARLLGVSRRTFVSRLDAFAIPRPHKAPLTTPAWS